MAMGPRDEAGNTSMPKLETFCSPKSVIDIALPKHEMCTEKRRVRFEKECKHISIPSALELTDEIITSLWYSDDEYRLFKRSLGFIVKMMEKDMKALENDEELCPRGLEAKTKMGNRNRRRMIEEGWDVVLYEQEQQGKQRKGPPNASRIARLYREATSTCSMEAFVRGKKDEKYVQNLKEDSA